MESAEALQKVVETQMKPRIHVMIEEKVPTVQYGNKTYRYDVSFHVDNLNKEELDKASKLVTDAIKQQKLNDGVIQETAIDKMPEEQKEDIKQKVEEEFKKQPEKPKGETYLDTIFKEQGLG